MSIPSTVSLHQVAFARDGTEAFVNFCSQNAVPNMTLVPLLMTEPGDVALVKRAGAGNGPRVRTINQPFAIFPNLEEDRGEAVQRLLAAIELSSEIGAGAIYLQTGGRGRLDWEQAAARFVDLIAPCKAIARQKNIGLMIENASAFNIDIHIAHTLADTILLAEMAEIGVCIDLHACWGEAGLAQLFRRALPITKLVQVSDYIMGDRSAPCRAVPGDGAIPLERLIRDLLDAGYEGLFDIELVGPRIDAEGAAASSLRALRWLSEILSA